MNVLILLRFISRHLRRVDLSFRAESRNNNASHLDFARCDIAQRDTRYPTALRRGVSLLQRMESHMQICKNPVLLKHIEML
jgi:hypothetical protein